MAIDPWIMDASGGAPAYGAQEIRLATVALTAGAGASLAARSGVRRSGSETDLLVAAQGVPNMSVVVNTGTAVIQGTASTSQGAYLYALDAATTVAIGASHATLSRTDRVCVRIRDASVDSSGARDGGLVVIAGTPGAGTPAMPTDATYFELAQVAVPAAATNIGGGGGQGTIADKRVYTCTAGGKLTGTNAQRLALTGMPLGQDFFETDTGRSYTWTGSAWTTAAITNVATKTANYTAVDTDSVILANGATVTITLPSAVAAGAGRQYVVKNINAAPATVNATAGTIDGAATVSLRQYDSRTFLSDGANWFII